MCKFGTLETIDDPLIPKKEMNVIEKFRMVEPESLPLSELHLYPRDDGVHQG